PATRQLDRPNLPFFQHRGCVRAHAMLMCADAHIIHLELGAPMSTVPAITRAEIQAMLDAGDDVTIVEALGPMYYDDAHLPGARNLPHDRVDELAAAVLPDKSAFVIVYCSNT